jgi:hypothetical protein
MVIRQADLVVGRSLVRGARCVRAFGHVTPGPAPSFPVTLYAVVFPVVLAVLLAAVWRHSHSTYSREYAEWSLSFICERAGS